MGTFFFFKTLYLKNNQNERKCNLKKNHRRSHRSTPTTLPWPFGEQLLTLSVSRAQEQSRTIYEGLVMKG